MTTPDLPASARCDVRYPSTDPTARIVHCGLPWEHTGEHAEEDGAPTWPRMPLAEAIVRTVAPTRADLGRAEQAAYARGVAEGLRRAATAVRAQAGLPDLVHFDRPSDFRKGVLTCLTALEALESKTAEEAPDA